MTVIKLGGDTYLDISTATNIPEFIRALRKSADEHDASKLGGTMQIQYEAIGACERDTADCLEKLWGRLSTQIT